MFKYLYLTKVEWADTWVKGGDIPISLASTYLHDERDGTLTPDENLIHESEVDLKSLSPIVRIEDGAQIGSFSMTNCTLNGERLPDIEDAKFYTEDGVILSFSNSLSSSIAAKLGKKCCVRVSKLKDLRKLIDKQLGVKGVMKECEYTDDHQRNHFLKSTEDSWQEEFRIFWKYSSNVTVTIPKGHAKLVATYD